MENYTRPGPHIYIPISTLVTHDKSCHRLVSRSGLDLVVCTVSFATLSTLEEIGFATLDISQLGCIDSLLNKCLSL
jgi:hypothetical protein